MTCSPGNIGCLHLAKGEHKQALQYHEQHLSLAQELENLPLQTKAYFNMGKLDYRLISSRFGLRPGPENVDVCLTNTKFSYKDVANT